MRNAVSLGIQSVDYDVIMLTEYWLSNYILSLQLFGTPYQVYRNDRNYTALNCKRGGAVVLVIRLDLPSEEINGSSKGGFNDSWVRVKFDGE